MMNKHGDRQVTSGRAPNQQLPVSTFRRNDTTGTQAPPAQPRHDETVPAGHHHHGTVHPGAEAVHGPDYVPGDARTVQIGGDNESVPSRAPSIPPITTTAHVVDTEEESRLRQAYERMARIFADAAVAQEVTPEDAAEQGGRDAEQETGMCPRCNKKWVAILTSGVLLLFAAVVITIVFGRTPTIAAPTLPPTVPLPTLPPTVPPTPSPLQDLLELLCPVAPDGCKALSTPDTPQYQAVNWLAGNTDLDSYNDAKKILRYTLATFYYSTEGDTWYDRDNWLDDGEECDRWWQFPSDTLQCADSGAVNIEFLTGEILDIIYTRHSL